MSREVAGNLGSPGTIPPKRSLLRNVLCSIPAFFILQSTTKVYIKRKMAMIKISILKGLKYE